MIKEIHRRPFIIAMQKKAIYENINDRKIYNWM